MVRYSFQRLWKNWRLYGAFAIVLLIVWNTNVLFQLVKEDERTKMELWAAAQRELVESTNLSREYGVLAFDVLQKIGVTPIIVVDANGKIVDHKNIDWSASSDRDSLELYAKLSFLKTQNDPIPIVYKDIVNQALFYGDTPLLVKLQYYPLALLLILFLFGGLLYFFFQTNKAGEQNKLWAGMAKETAHQIGTPLTSLMGWIALLKEEKVAPTSIQEMEKDIARLEMITERFSKVGSLPERHEQDAVALLQDTLNYLKKRSGQQITWAIDLPNHSILLPMNTTLLSWTVENLVKNAIDAMKGKGRLGISLQEEHTRILVYFSDTGSGIPSGALKKVFRPGFTTKKRGWGLGLSLARRIIEDYHQGRIWVKETALGKGTTFCVELPKKAIQ